MWDLQKYKPRLLDRLPAPVQRLVVIGTLGNALRGLNWITGGLVVTLVTGVMAVVWRWWLSWSLLLQATFLFGLALIVTGIVLRASAWLTGWKTKKNQLPDIKLNEQMWPTDYWPGRGEFRVVILKEVRIANREDHPISVEMGLVVKGSGGGYAIMDRSMHPIRLEQKGNELPKVIRVKGNSVVTGWAAYRMDQLVVDAVGVGDPEAGPALRECELQIEDVHTGKKENFPVGHIVFNQVEASRSSSPEIKIEKEGSTYWLLVTARETAVYKAEARARGGQGFYNAPFRWTMIWEPSDSRPECKILAGLSARLLLGWTRGSLGFSYWDPDGGGHTRTIDTGNPPSGAPTVDKPWMEFDLILASDHGSPIEKRLRFDRDGVSEVESAPAPVPTETPPKLPIAFSASAVFVEGMGDPAAQKRVVLPKVKITNLHEYRKVCLDFSWTVDQGARVQGAKNRVYRDDERPHIVDPNRTYQDSPLNLMPGEGVDISLKMDQAPVGGFPLSQTRFSLRVEDRVSGAAEVYTLPTDGPVRPLEPPT